MCGPGTQIFAVLLNLAPKNVLGSVDFTQFDTPSAILLKKIHHVLPPNLNKEERALKSIVSLLQAFFLSNKKKSGRK